MKTSADQLYEALQVLIRETGADFLHFQVITLFLILEHILLRITTLQQ